MQRRNSLYRNIGFKIEPYKFILKILDLNLNRKLEYIKTLNYSKYILIYFLPYKMKKLDFNITLKIKLIQIKRYTKKKTSAIK